GYADLNRCPAAAWSPACRSGPCNCLSAARPSIFCLNALCPVSPVEIRLVSGPLAVCDCSCAMAGDSAAITSEAVTPSTRLREGGRIGSSSLEADRAGWLKKLRRTLRFLLPTSEEPSCFIFHAQFIRREAHRACLQRTFRRRREGSDSTRLTKSGLTISQPTP